MKKQANFRFWLGTIALGALIAVSVPAGARRGGRGRGGPAMQAGHRGGPGLHQLWQLRDGLPGHEDRQGPLGA